VIQLESNKSQNCGGDCDIGNNKKPPIERLLKRSKSLDKEEEYVKKQIESVDPNATKRFEWIRGWVDALFYKSTTHSKVREYNSRPGDVGC
jgi:hypothetical protein